MSRQRPTPRPLTRSGRGVGSFEESGRRDSNPRHQAWKASALPTELLPRGTAPARPDCGGPASGGGRIRTFEGLRRQIYSLIPLATWVPHPGAGVAPALPGQADDRNRTGNRLITNQVLCQLSYVSTMQHASAHPAHPRIMTGRGIGQDRQITRPRPRNQGTERHALGEPHASPGPPLRARRRVLDRHPTRHEFRPDRVRLGEVPRRPRRLARRQPLLHPRRQLGVRLRLGRHQV